jgi:hypothetical protein
MTFYEVKKNHNLTSIKNKEIDPNISSFHLGHSNTKYSNAWTFQYTIKKPMNYKYTSSSQ